jgi:TniQ
VTTSPLPRRLPITVPPAHHETVASYLARLATLNSLDGDELWLRISTPNPTPSRRAIDLHHLAALTGRPEGHLAGALLELRDPPPTWPAFRHNPQIGCPRCDARHPGGPVYRTLPHHRYMCTRHHYWIGPPDINRPGPDVTDFPAITTAQRRHLALVREHGWAAAYDAVLTAFMICGHLWDRHREEEPPVRTLMRVKWDTQTLILIPEGTEQSTFTASALFAPIYPDAVKIAALLAAPHWRTLAAGDEHELSRFTAAIGPRIGDPHYAPSDYADPVAHWIEQDCWRPPSSPPTTFPQAPGHRRPSHLANTVSAASTERHRRAAIWFGRNRRAGSVILHHRAIHPVVIREWSIKMELYDGAIWQSQRTLKRFRRVDPQ